MKKILYIVPHLSTGGLPQYTLKMIQEFSKESEIYCIEYQDISGGVLVVQRDKIIDLLNNKFYSLRENKIEMVDIINGINPDIIHFQEIPDSFVDVNILEQLYNSNRKYDIVVTTHGSMTDPSKIVFGGDKYVLVSEWSRDKFIEVFDASVCDVWEYPTEKIEYDKTLAKKDLGFDLRYTHVLNVGLFTSGKNQKELVELAKEFKNEKVIFHFVGNQAANFKDYWEPIMKDFPDNCIWHGERNDVERFYKAADVFYFTSNLELNPLVVKEALSYGLPTFIKKLDTYKDTYNGVVTYITDNKISNIHKLRNLLTSYKNSNATTIIVSHADNPYRKQLLEDCLNEICGETILSSNYFVDEKTQKMCDYVLYMKENPLLFDHEFPKYALQWDRWWIDEFGTHHSKPLTYEHGYAVYVLMKNAIRYAKSMGRKKIHVINYDYMVSDDLFKKNEEILNEYDLIFYDDRDDTQSFSEYSGYSSTTGFFSGNIDAIQPFFEKYKSLDEYYSDRYETCTLELKIYKYYENSNYKIFRDSYRNLKEICKTNRESLLEFSKSNLY